MQSQRLGRRYLHPPQMSRAVEQAQLIRHFAHAELSVRRWLGLRLLLPTRPPSGGTAPACHSRSATTAADAPPAVAETPPAVSRPSDSPGRSAHRPSHLHTFERRTCSVAATGAAPAFFSGTSISTSAGCVSRVWQRQLRDHLRIAHLHLPTEAVSSTSCHMPVLRSRMAGIQSQPSVATNVGPSSTIAPPFSPGPPLD